MPLASHVLGDRVRASYLGLLIGDALSMPVHWYYNPSHITRDFGRITTFQAPKAAHPSSIMTLSNTGGAGRGAQTGSIIGDVINHGKKQFWGVPNMHYHQGMAAGENTLNAVVARLLVRTLAGLPRAADAAAAAAAAGAPAAPAAPAAALATAPYSTAPFLAAYVAFMTTPGSHNDTYAETYHRMFFKNLREGRAPEACADDDKHNVDSAGGLVLLPPPALLAAAAAAARSNGGSAAEAEAAAKAAARAAATAQMFATHKSQRLAGFVGVYADALAGALTSQLPPGEALRQATQAAGKALGLDIAKLVRDTPGQGQDTSVVGGTFTSACEWQQWRCVCVCGKRAGVGRPQPPALSACSHRAPPNTPRTP